MRVKQFVKKIVMAVISTMLLLSERASAQKPPSQPLTLVFGYNEDNDITHPRGEFIEDVGKVYLPRADGRTDMVGTHWTEYTKKAWFKFVQTNTDANWIYIRDDSRNMNIRLPVRGGWCSYQYSETLQIGGPWRDLYWMLPPKRCLLCDFYWLDADDTTISPPSQDSPAQPHIIFSELVPKDRPSTISEQREYMDRLRASEAEAAKQAAAKQARDAADFRAAHPPPPPIAAGGAAATAINDVRLLGNGNVNNGCFGQFAASDVVNSSTRAIVVTVHVTINYGPGGHPPNESNRDVTVPAKGSVRLGCGGQIGGQITYSIVAAHY